MTFVFRPEKAFLLHDCSLINVLTDFHRSRMDTDFYTSRHWQVMSFPPGPIHLTIAQLGRIELVIDGVDYGLSRKRRRLLAFTEACAWTLLVSVPMIENAASSPYGPDFLEYNVHVHYAGVKFEHVECTPLGDKVFEP